MRPNLDSQLRHQQVVADTMVHRDAADWEVLADLEVVLWAAVVDRSTSPTFVTSNPLFLCQLVVGMHIDFEF